MNESLKRYMTKEYPINSVYLEIFSKIKSGSFVLSVGCGSGREVSYLLNKLGCKVVAIDINKDIINLSKGIINKNVEYICMNMKDYKSNKKFDYIISLWNTINYLNEKDKNEFIKNCYSNLKDEGELIITTEGAFTYWRNFFHNIKYLSFYYPFKLNINKWFRGTEFVFSKKKIKRCILIMAKKTKKIPQEVCNERGE